MSAAHPQSINYTRVEAKDVPVGTIAYDYNFATGKLRPFRLVSVEYRELTGQNIYTFVATVGEGLPIRTHGTFWVYMLSETA